MRKGDKRRLAADTAAGAGATPPTPTPTAIISERLTAAAALPAEPCRDCGVRRSSGPGWAERCSGCFHAAPWAELLRDAPLPNAHLTAALSAHEVERRLRAAAAAGDPPAAEQEDEAALRAQFASLGLGKEALDDLVKASLQELADSAPDPRLRERLSRAGVGEAQVRADGNCQFSALALTLCGATRFHRALRAAAHHWLWERRAERRYAAMLPAGYYDELACDRWGDAQTLEALANVTGSRIVVASGEPGQRWVVTATGCPTASASPRLAVLTLGSAHYNAAVPAELEGLAAASVTADRLEAALADVRAAADAGEGMVEAERAAQALADSLLPRYGVDLPLWAKALAAAQRPQRAAALAPDPGRLELCAAEEKAARAGVARERESGWRALVSAHRVAERLLERAVRRAADAERRAAAEGAARRAAERDLAAAEGRAAAAERKAAATLGEAARRAAEAKAEKAARLAAEKDLRELRGALAAAQQRERLRAHRAAGELARAARKGGKEVSLLEQTEREELRAARELQGRTVERMEAGLAARRALLSAAAEQEARERRLLQREESDGLQYIAAAAGDAREEIFTTQESDARAALCRAADSHLAELLSALLGEAAGGCAAHCASAASYRADAALLAAQLRAARLVEPLAREEQRARDRLAAGALSAMSDLLALAAVSLSALGTQSLTREYEAGRERHLAAERACWAAKLEDFRSREAVLQREGRERKGALRASPAPPPCGTGQPSAPTPRGPGARGFAAVARMFRRARDAVRPSRWRGRRRPPPSPLSPRPLLTSAAPAAAQGSPEQWAESAATPAASSSIISAAPQRAAALCAAELPSRGCGGLSDLALGEPEARAALKGLQTAPGGPVAGAERPPEFTARETGVFALPAAGDVSPLGHPTTQRTGSAAAPPRPGCPAARGSASRPRPGARR
eukprot:TRINITY_DN7244_c0_g1_i3.p1 TRINITY_DN7244_c0_g1~~TRINITY_DN7244_c0_g1_i3.p1  ORF type:complete len:930 (+),score=268.80 TRINITY_DN7244_c0_g1_i3:68-2857(+)